MRSSTDVLIAGAGPVGLMLAIELQRRGVDHLLIEQRSEPAYFVKALGITPRMLEIWDQIGLVREALDAGLVLRGTATLINGEVVDTQEMTFDRSTFPFLALAQYDAERLLRRHLLGRGGAVRWGACLTGFDATDDRVRARLRDADGAPRTVECRYLVGCDGAHSAVRHGLGLEYAGAALPMTFALGDVALQWELARGFAYRMLQMDGEQMTNQSVAVPIPGDPRRYRVSMAAPPECWEADADLSTPPSLALLAETLAPMLPRDAALSDLRWGSFYRISHRIVPRYSYGRVFLAGDAAHIHPPVGGQGMNTGLHDAFNLGWKLALATAGRAAPDLLESYGAERHPVGLEVVERTSRRMDEAIEGTDRGESRDQMLLDSQVLVGYRDSRWVCEAAGTALANGPRAGDRAPDADGLTRPGVSAPLRLHDLLRHEKHTLLLYAGAEMGEAEGRAFAAMARDVPRDLVEVYGIAAPVARPVDRECFAWITDAGGRFQAAYDTAAAAVYLIRPDGMIGYRAAGSEAAALRAALERVIRPGSRPLAASGASA